MVIPTQQTIINLINEMGVSEKQPEGIQFTNRDSKVSINNLDLNLYNDDNNSNASDESFVHNDEFNKEFEKEGKDENLTTDEVHENYFQLPFQLHHALLTHNQSK